MPSFANTPQTAEEVAEDRAAWALAITEQAIDRVRQGKDLDCFHKSEVCFLAEYLEDEVQQMFTRGLRASVVVQNLMVFKLQGNTHAVLDFEAAPVIITALRELAASNVLTAEALEFLLKVRDKILRFEVKAEHNYAQT